MLQYNCPISVTPSHEVIALMWKIRQQQMDTLSEVSLKSFEDRMISFLQKHFPDQCEKLEQSGVRMLVHRGIARAREHGFLCEQDVCQFVALMILLGANFDRNPALPATQQVLNDADLNDFPELKMVTLYAAAEEDMKTRTVGNPSPGL